MQGDAAAFEESFPASPLVVDLHWKSRNANWALSEDAEVTPDFAIFAKGHDAATLEAADRFLKRHEIPPSRVFACLGSEMELFEAGSIRGSDRDFALRNLFALGLGKVDPLETEIDKDAMECHAIYWRNERAKNPEYGSREGDHPRDWNKLPERYRESNRLAAMHHQVKRCLWRARQPGDESQVLEHLARCEHMRWMAEKVMDGWRWSGSLDPSSRSNEKLRHHLLVPYDALDRSEKDKDYNAFLWALDLPLELTRRLGVTAADSPA
jgi:hypothetical protein